MKKILVILSIVGFCSCDSNEPTPYTETIPDELLDGFPSKAAECDRDCMQPLNQKGKIFCLPDTACTNTLTCGCILWRCKKKEKEVIWDSLGTGRYNYDPKTYVYRCVCQK